MVEKLKYQNIIEKMTLKEKALLLSGRNVENTCISTIWNPGVLSVRRTARDEDTGGRRGLAWH